MVLMAAHMPPLMPSGGRGPLEWVTVASSMPASFAIVVYQLHTEGMAWDANGILRTGSARLDWKLGKSSFDAVTYSAACMMPVHFCPTIFAGSPFVASLLSHR